MELSAKSYLDPKAVVKIRFYLRGNLGLKVEEEDLQAPESPPIPAPSSLFFFWVSLVRERVQIAQVTPETLLSPRSFFKDLQGLPR